VIFFVLLLCISRPVACNIQKNGRLQSSELDKVCLNAFIHPLMLFSPFKRDKFSAESLEKLANVNLKQLVLAFTLLFLQEAFVVCFLLRDIFSMTDDQIGLM